MTRRYLRACVSEIQKGRLARDKRVGHGAVVWEREDSAPSRFFAEHGAQSPKLVFDNGREWRCVQSPRLSHYEGVPFVPPVTQSWSWSWSAHGMSDELVESPPTAKTVRKPSKVEPSLFCRKHGLILWRRRFREKEPDSQPLRETKPTFDAQTAPSRWDAAALS